MHILVIDVGTSSIRGVIYDKTGLPLFWHPIEYRVSYLGKNIAEQNPADWSDSVYLIARKAAEFAVNNHFAIDGISLTSQRSSIIPVDHDGKALRPAIMWQDRRNADIVKEFEKYQNTVHALTGARINTVFSGTKMTWFKKNEPELYKKTMKICTIADYITSRITGSYVTDCTYGARSLLMNIRSLQWEDSLLELFEIDKEKLCTLAPAGSIIGTVSDQFARTTGLKSGIPLISAGGDQQCAAVGKGVTEKGSVEITTGTGAFILGYSDSVPEGLSPDIICGAHAISGKYVLESSMLSCAAMYNWGMRTLFSESSDIRDINAAVDRSPAGANGCIVLPYFQGRGTPDFNNQASGCFANLNLGTTRDDMVRSLLESIAYEVNINLSVMEKYLGNITKVHAGGGLTQFPTFNQIQADVYQKDVLHDTDSSEQTSFGAWAVAAVTLGLYDNCAQAIAHENQKHNIRVYHPDPETCSVYKKAQDSMETLYRKIYSN